MLDDSSWADVMEAIEHKYDRELVLCASNKENRIECLKCRACSIRRPYHQVDLVEQLFGLLI